MVSPTREIIVVDDRQNEEDDVPNLHCGECAHWNFRDGCPRVDDKRIQFYRPWFRTADHSQHNGCICNLFEPRMTVNGRIWCYEWRGFDEYWKKYVEQWLPYSNINTTRGFFVGDNTDVHYNVPLLRYLYGDMWDGDKLLATEKVYYKKCKEGFGYKLIREPIDGVRVVQNEEGKWVAQ